MKTGRGPRQNASFVKLHGQNRGRRPPGGSPRRGFFSFLATFSQVVDVMKSYYFTLSLTKFFLIIPDEKDVEDDKLLVENVTLIKTTCTLTDISLEIKKVLWY